MAKAKQHTPVLRFAAIFSGHDDAVQWARERASSQWGDIACETGNLKFDCTTYYQATMGTNLKKRLVAFRNLIDPTEIVQAKLDSNRWETELQDSEVYSESRPVNIDPGYVSEAKVVLATMKDRDHRLYLGRGVFGEVTLFYQLPGQWVESRWTYLDYRSSEYHRFFSDCRQFLRRCLQSQIESR